MKNYIVLGNRYVTRKKMRAALVVISMILASALIYITVVVALGAYINGRVTSEEHADYYTKFPEVSAAQQQIIENYANVDGTVRGIQTGNVELESYGNWKQFVLMKLETMDQDIFGYQLLEGRVPETSDELMLNRSALDSLSQEKKVGDTIRLDFISYDDEGQEISRVSKEYTLCGVYENTWELDDYHCWGYTLAGEGETLDSYVRFHRKYHWTKDAEALAAAAGITVDKYGHRYYVNEDLQLYYLQNEVVFVDFILLMMVVVLLIYFCTVMARSLMSTNMIDKLRDYTILKSMGATNRQLQKILMRESLLEGAIAYVGGIILGQLVISLVLVKVCQLHTLSFQYIWMALIINALFLWITIELAAIEPFMYIKKQTIMGSIGKNIQIKKSPKVKRPSLLYKCLRIEGQYAYKNAHRNRKSFWNPVAAFTLSILIITMTATIIYNFGALVDIIDINSLLTERDYLYDIDVNVQAEDEMLSDLVSRAEEALRIREDVTAVYPAVSIIMLQNESDTHFNIKPETYNALRGYLSGSSNVVEVILLTKDELKKLNPYMENGKDAYEAVKDGGMLVQNTLTDADGNSYQLFNIKEGDRVSMGSLEMYAERYNKTGETEIEFIKYAKEHNGYDNIVVKGTLKASNLTGSFSRVVVMSYEYICDTCGQEFLNGHLTGFHLDIDEKNFDSDSFSSLVAQQAVLESWNYTDPDKVINEFTKTFRYSVIVIVTFIMVLGIVSVINTMLNEQLQRKKENAILRAIGMSKSSLNKMLIIEKMLIGFTAWIIGTLAAYGLSRLFLIATIEIEGVKFSFPWRICGITCAVIVVIMGLLSWLMIHISGKLDISEGIRNEG